VVQFSCLAEQFLSIWPAIFVLDLARYLVAAGVLVLLLVAFAGNVARRRIQGKVASMADIRREFLYSLLTAFLFSLVGFGVFLGSEQGFFRVYRGDLPHVARLAFEFIAVVLLHDAYFYWLHRALHHRLLFRRVHRLHHKSRVPTPWAAYSFAPQEALLEAAIIPLATLMIPMHELTMFLFVSHMIIRNVVGHAGFELFPGWWLDAPLLRFVTTTTHHDLHHSQGRCNYGLYFTWWDRWMRTEHPEYATRFLAATRSERTRRGS
jgi:sterol desaturase/sphingolipid hydroxylase (fatty acid hydroxylase superfamily)